MGVLYGMETVNSEDDRYSISDMWYSEKFENSQADDQDRLEDLLSLWEGNLSEASDNLLLGD